MLTKVKRPLVDLMNEGDLVKVTGFYKEALPIDPPLAKALINCAACHLAMKIVLFAPMIVHVLLSWHPLADQGNRNPD